LSKKKKKKLRRNKDRPINGEKKRGKDRGNQEKKKNTD